MFYKQKGNFQKVVRWMGGKWMTANQATFLGCLCIVFAALGLYFGLTAEGYRWLLLLVPFFMLMRMAMNTLDGLLSREYKTATVAGEIFNEALDIIGDTVCYGALYFVPAIPYLPLTLFLFSTWAAEFFGVLGKGMPNGVRRHESFLGGKPDRAIWMGILALILFFNPGFIQYSSYYFLGLSALIIITCVIRIRKIIQASKGQKYESYTWIGR